MKNPKWEDITSHRRGESDECRKEVRTVQIFIGRERVIVTQHIHGDPDHWSLSVGSEIFPLRSKTLKVAKIEALNVMKDRAEAIIRDVNAVLNP